MARLARPSRFLQVSQAASPMPGRGMDFGGDVPVYGPCRARYRLLRPGPPLAGSYRLSDRHA